MNMGIANTILTHMGGYRFTAMTGAREFGATKTGVQFKVPRVRNGITRVVIDLNPMDTYDVRFYKIRKYEPILVEERLGVYADQLQAVFTDVTGLDTTL